MHLYTAIESPKTNVKEDSSWPFYYTGKEKPYFSHHGYFIEGKQYMCLPGDSLHKIKVRGFFKMFFTTQKFEGKNLIDDTRAAHMPGYYELNFDRAVCEKYLKFIQKL